MNKKIAFLFAGLCAATAFAGMDNVVITFSADEIKYADGTPALAGESVAAVLVKDGATLTTINADGSANEGCKVVFVAPAIKDGGVIPRTMFDIDEGLLSGGGTVVLAFLDTRKYATAADGTILSDVEKVGWDKTGLINSFVVSGIENAGTAGSAKGVKLEIATGIPTVGAPVITGIKTVGDKVHLTVKNTAKCLKYAVSAGVAGEMKAEEALRYGNGDSEMIIIRDVKPEGELISVGVAK